MSAAPGHPPPSASFRIRAGRRLGTILLILAVLAAAALAFGALLEDEVEVEVVVEEPGPVLPGAIEEAVPVAAPAASAGGTLAAGRPSLLVQADESFGPDGQGVLVVPEGWDVLARTDDGITLGTGDGLRFEARILAATPATPATELVTERAAVVLGSDLAADVHASTVLALQPFGRLVTRSALGYSALRTDLQALSWVGGDLFAFVRDDGLALEVRVEVTPATDWDARIAEWTPLWDSAVSNFAGAPVPA